MTPSVILVLALVTSGLALPFTQDTTIIGTQTGIHTEGGTPITQTFTHGEKTGIVQPPEGQTYNTATGHQTTNQVTQTGEKTGLQGTPEGYTQQQTGVYSDLQEKQTGYENPQPVVTQVGQSGVQSETYVQQKYPESQTVNSVVPKTQNQQVNYEQQQQQQQTPYTERPVLLPIQPLSVVPVGQGLTPVVVPSEAIAAGRIIIMTVEPIRQQITPQDIISTVEKQVPYPQVTQPIVSDYVPVQNPVQVSEPSQQVYSSQPAQACPPCSEQNFPCPPCPQVYQPVQKQQVGVVPPQTTTYQESNTRSEPVTTTFEKQTVGEYTPTQTQTGVNQQQYPTSQQVVPTQVEKQGTPYTPTQGQTHQQGSVVGTVERQTYQPVSENTQVQNPAVQPYYSQQQTYNVQQQVSGQNVVEKQVPQTQTQTQTQVTPNQEYKTGAVEQQQYNYPQTQEVSQQQSTVQQVSNYVGERVPVFGEKLHYQHQQQQQQQQQQYVEPQNVETQTPVQTYSGVPQSVVPEPSQVVSQVSSK